MYKSLRLITFDATNTLIQVAGKIGTEYAKIGSIYGVKGADNPEKIEKLNHEFKNSFTKFSRDLPNYGYHHNISPVEWWSRVVLSSFENSGFDLADPSDRKRVESTAAHLYKLYSRGSQWNLKPGAHNLLFELRKQRPDLALSVISNFDERLETILHDLGIAHFFKHLFISHRLGLAKPDEELFQHALKKHNIVDASTEYLHIGDNVELDYKPVVEQLGGRALLINSSLATQSDQALVAAGVDSASVFSSLPDIQSFLLEHCSTYSGSTSNTMSPPPQAPPSTTA